jgi:CMP/dCMP kinase
MIITIDGPVATGKSSIARKLAEELGYIFFDTGAMYRCLTHSLLKNSINIDNPDELKAALDKFQFDIKVKQGIKRYFADNEDVTEAIRTQRISENVSRVSALAPVREKLTKIQRQLSVGINAVFEGRDMGSYVFPDANIKIFLTGDSKVRAQRRYEEILRESPNEAAGLTVEKVLEDLNKRDAYDSTREISPLRKAADAYEIDTTNLTLDEVVFRILEYKDTIKSKAQPNR